MKNIERVCKICKTQYLFTTTGNDLCGICTKKYPYFLSFIEEGYVGVNDVVFGRVEIYTNLKPEDYAIDELRFAFAETDKNRKEFYDFREKWDFEDVTEKEFEAIKLELKKRFNEPLKN